MAAALVLAATSGGVFWYTQWTKAATYHWVQTDWSGGATTTTATHASNQSGWTFYEEKDAATFASSSISIATSSSSTVQTTDTDFNAGTFTSQTEVVGTGTDAYVRAVPGDFLTAGAWDPPAPVSASSLFNCNGPTRGPNGSVYQLISSSVGRALVRFPGSDGLNGWVSGATPPINNNECYDLAWDGNDFIYMAGVGTDNSGLRRYSISGNAWVSLASSTIDFPFDNTLAYYNGYLYATQGTNRSGFTRYNVSTDSWETLTSFPANWFGGQGLLSTNDGYLYAARGNNTTSFYRYSVADNAWTQMANAPGILDDVLSSSLAWDEGDYIYAYVEVVGTGGKIFRYSISGNSWTTLPSVGPSPNVNGNYPIVYTGGSSLLVLNAAISQVALRYNIDADQWGLNNLSSSATSSYLLPTGLNNVGSAGVLVSTGDGYLYAHRGTATSSGETNNFFRYDTNAKTWTGMAPLFSTTTFSALTYPGSGDYIYMRQATAFSRYSISGNSWSSLASAPDGGRPVEAGDSGHIYAAGPNTTRNFWRYNIGTDTWEVMASTTGCLVMQSGSVLKYTGGDSIFLAPGAGTCGGFTPLYLYSISGNSWSTVTNFPVTWAAGATIGWASSTPDYLWYKPASSVGAYRYSISGNSWTQVGSSTFSDSVNSLAYPGSGNFLYKLSTTRLERFALTGTPFTPPAEFESSVIDLGQASSPTTFQYASSPTLAFQLRSADTEEDVDDATWRGPTGTGDFYTGTSTTINSAHAGDRYFQYRVLFNGLNNGPLQSATINYDYFLATSTTLTSSAFNAEDAANVLASLSWDETKPSNTDVRFQIRTAPDTGSSTPGTWTDWLGPDGTSDTYFTDPAGDEDMPEEFADGIDDQWMQHRITLTTDGSATPEVGAVTLTYVVNAPPEFDPDYPIEGGGGAAAVQNSDGTVAINYSVRDPDTTTGTASPNELSPTFEYSLDGGSTWSPVDPDTLAPGDADNQGVLESDFTVLSATWNVTEQFTGSYDTDARIRVTVDDNEAANNVATTTTINFTLDTTAPSSTTARVDASVSPALISMTASDDSAIEMRIGNEEDLSDADWVPFATTSTTTLSDGEELYVQFRDEYDNRSAIIDATPPQTPQNLFYADISNPGAGLFQEFVAWNVIPLPPNGFGQYSIWRSVDGNPFELIASSTDRLTNYYADFDLNPESEYQYKVTSQSGNGSISFFSEATPQDPPDGTGGSADAPPVISSVAAVSVGPTTVTITWDTNKLSNSTVFFEAATEFPGTDPSDYSASTTLPSMLESHSVILAGLSPSTQYFFLVRSEDPASLQTSTTTESFTFTTTPGAVISNTSAVQVFDTEATITWDTDIAATTVVTYDTDPNFSDPIQEPGESSVTFHSVTLSGLTSGETYWYFVTSVAGANTTHDRNVQNGVEQNYSFNTTEDSTAPVISNVDEALVSDDGVVIAWNTNEPARSSVEWGSDTDYGTVTATTTSFSPSQSVTITGLAASTTYFYRVFSADSGGNTAMDDNGGEGYSFTTAEEATTTIIILPPEDDGDEGGGGGGGNVDLTDPEITELKVDAVGGTSAYISFKTSKVANGQVEYGPTVAYGATAGDPTIYRTEHTITLLGLTPLTTYHVRALSSDVYNNTDESDDLSFTTLAADAPVQEQEDEEEDESADATERARRASLLGIVDSIANMINSSSIPKELLADTIKELLARAVDSPIISGTDLTVETTSRGATIRWTTDQTTNSLVAYAKERDYDPTLLDPYTITAGSPTERVLRHTVVLDNLEPATTYHFQVRSESAAGIAGLSQDSTFTTRDIVPVISDAAFETLEEDTAVLRWRTDVPTRSSFELENAETGEIINAEDGNYLRDHTYRFAGLDVSTPYTLRLVATDDEGNRSDTFALPFTTVVSGNPPTISNVRVTTALIPGRIETAQTIVSWKTDKPATSRVLFDQGGSTTLRQSTALDATLVRDHVVITTALKPGTVYKVRVESGDSAGSIVQSDAYTVLTARPTASVIDLIFEGLGRTFGFLRQ